MSTPEQPHTRDLPPQQPPVPPNSVAYPASTSSYPPPPFGYPPGSTPPVKRRKGLYLTLGVLAWVALVAVVGGCTLLGGNSVARTSAFVGVGALVASPAPIAGLNQPVRDGKFEFVVTKVQCGVATVGDDFLAQAAQGQYCLVTMSVKNIGDKAQSFFDNNQRAYGTNGARYDSSSMAGVVVNKDNGGFAELNPGNGITAVVVFDIPKGAVLQRLELHDSLFSNGVKVTLG